MRESTKPVLEGPSGTAAARVAASATSCRPKSTRVHTLRTNASSSMAAVVASRVVP